MHCPPLFLRSEVAALSLLHFDCFEEGLEVAGAEALVVPSLDNFQEKGRAILQRLRENLEKVSLIVVVNKDLLALKDIDILLHLHVDFAEANSEVVVVGVWDLLEELDTAGFHPLDSVDDALGAHGNVLHASTTVIIAELLDLALLAAIGGLVDRHLDLLVEVGHHD